jgi:hypothetical protein
MNPHVDGGGPARSPLASIRRFMRPKAARERCALCGTELGADHPHLVEPSSRRLSCACDACALLFSGQGGARFRRVPSRVRALPDFALSDATWDGLQLPINLAFFLRSTPEGRVVALYPSPAGATEATVDEQAWRALEEDNPILRDFETDVEGLLVNRVGEARDCYRVGVDECYRLVGLIRAHWRGLSGGAEVWGEIARFFAELRERSS